MKLDPPGIDIRIWTDEHGYCAHCRTCGWGVRRAERESRAALIVQHERGHRLADRRAQREEGT